MAEKQTVVIKKITVVAGGHHGGAWKVAFADFMTALMAFFMVMWLLSQPEETKESIAEYFSTPSIIEYNFSNYGVELTLEKLFLDLVNEPLKTFQDFMKPYDSTPNLMAMGHKKIALQFMADQLEELGVNVKLNSDTVEFEIMDSEIFVTGTATPSGNFVDVMDRIKSLTAGLENSDVELTSSMFYASVIGRSPQKTKFVAQERVDLLAKGIKQSLEHDSVKVKEFIVTGKAKNSYKQGIIPGKIKFKIKQREFDQEGNKTKKLEEIFESSEDDTSAYNQFVDQLTKRRAKK